MHVLHIFHEHVLYVSVRIRVDIIRTVVHICMYVLCTDVCMHVSGLTYENVSLNSVSIDENILCAT